MKPQVMPIVFLLLAAFILLNAVAVLADGPVYTGAEKMLKCTNATERTDGTPLSIDEIDRVEIHISQIDKDSAPAYTVVMQGGCVDMPFSLTPLDEGQYYQYGVTYDTAGRVSALSASFPFIRSLTAPQPPVMVE